LIPSDGKRNVAVKNHGATDGVSLRFQAGSEQLQPRTDSQ